MLKENVRRDKREVGVRYQYWKKGEILGLKKAIFESDIRQ